MRPSPRTRLGAVRGGVDTSTADNSRRRRGGKGSARPPSSRSRHDDRQLAMDGVPSTWRAAKAAGPARIGPNWSAIHFKSVRSACSSRKDPIDRLGAHVITRRSSPRRHYALASSAKIPGRGPRRVRMMSQWTSTNQEPATSSRRRRVRSGLPGLHARRQRPLFARRDAVEQAGAWCDRLIDALEKAPQGPGQYEPDGRRAEEGRGQAAPGGRPGTPLN